MTHRSFFPLSLAVALLLCFVSCKKEPHFITDPQYRAQVHADFEARTPLAAGRADALFAGMDTLRRQEREALEFLYAYMPYSDLADYDQAFYLKQVRTAFAARDTFAWGRQVPEDIFRHFVLPYRVNNEDLDTARLLMFNTLKDRVKGLPMEEAALEVNHWCHEHVAYRAADSRTSAPLATMRTSLGRCGEESTFAVTALRSVGIPARQCYTPRWAHCDDNHAWVEVWVADSNGQNGQWKFLGACEPDPLLDMGWFSVPSTRCMMVHSKAFGRYKGDEEVVKSTSLYSELNLLSHYAPTAKVTITVVDAAEKPIEGAEVKFKLYNYAEYYTLATIKTDASGNASLTTGLGDLLIWAADGTHYNYQKLDTRSETSLQLALTRTAGEEYIEELNIVPPAAGEAKVSPSQAQQDANAKRLAYEDSLRNAYTSTFPQSEAELFATLSDTVECYLDPEARSKTWELVKKAEGNHQLVFDYLRISHEEEFDDNYQYLTTYSDKDLRDISREVLDAQRTWYKEGSNYSREVYDKGILPARISNELVRSWRKPLAEALKQIKSADELKAWTLKNISVDDTGNYYRCPISPMGVYELRHSDPHSRDIFFVAACRSLNIPAYLDNATNTIYVWQNGDWTKLSFDDSTPASTTVKLTLTYKGKEPQVPVYWPHYTLQKFENGDFATFDFEDDPRVAKFPATLDLEPGYYCLSTGSRYPDGEVLSRMEFFEVKEGQNQSRAIVLRPLTAKSQVCATIDSKMEIIEGMATLAEYAGTKGLLFISLGDYREPSKHLIKELQSLNAQYKAWGGMMYLLAPEHAKAMGWNLPNADISVWNSTNRDPLEKQLVDALKIKGSDPYPIVAYINNRGEVLFHSEGYKIGLAEQLLKTIK